MGTALYPGMEPTDNWVPLYGQKVLKMPGGCHSWCRDTLQNREIHYCKTQTHVSVQGHTDDYTNAEIRNFGHLFLIKMPNLPKYVLVFQNRVNTSYTIHYIKNNLKAQIIKKEDNSVIMPLFL